RWRNQGPTFTARLPLFPGYVFLHADADGREIVYDRTQVANCLRVPDQERMWQDLVRVFDLMTSGHPMTPEEKLPPGARVVITDGPLRGLEGKVIRHGTQCRLVLEVAFIQRGVSVELENWMVKPAGRESGPERLVAGPRRLALARGLLIAPALRITRRWVAAHHSVRFVRLERVARGVREHTGATRATRGCLETGRNLPTRGAREEPCVTHGERVRA